MTNLSDLLSVSPQWFHMAVACMAAEAVAVVLRLVAVALARKASS